MDVGPDPSSDPDLDPALLEGLNFDQRFERLRGVITRLYRDNKLKLPRVIEEIHTRYNFKAEYAEI